MIFLLIILVMTFYYIDRSHYQDENTLKMNKYFKISSTDIVISHYNTSIDWLKNKEIYEIIKNKQIRFFIYTNGRENLDFEFITDIYPNSKIIYNNLPNVGTCDHTYLYHIIKNYDDLADSTYFLPDTLVRQNKINLYKKIFKEDYSSNYSVFPWIKNINVENFTMDEYVPTNQRAKYNIKDINFVQNSIRPYGKWFQSVTGNIYKKGIVSYGGVFMASKHAIKRRPLSFYENLIRDLKYTHSELAHYIERLWYWIFNGPINNKYKLVIIAMAKK